MRLVSPAIASALIELSKMESVSSKVHWPKYSEGGENMVWQTQGSIVEKDVSRFYCLTIFWRNYEWVLTTRVRISGRKG
jgi:hypothetical protein